jgi:hypothetical protein
MVINPSGNVGIGTTNPTALLEVYQAASAVGVGNFTLNTPSTTGATRLGFKEAGSMVGQIAYSHDNNNLELLAYESGAGMVFYTSGTNERMRITSGGNVGIGTNNPIYPVVIWNRGPTGLENRSLAIGNTNTNGTFMFLGTSATTGGYGVIQHISSEGVSYGNLILQPEGAVVGIGTTNPSYALDVYNTGASTARVRIVGTTNFSLLQAQNTSGVLYLGIDDSTGSGFALGAYSRIIWSSAAYPLIFAVNDAERMRIASDGNVGIGITNPTAKLHVSGDVKASLANVNQSNFVAYNSSTGLFTYASTGSIVIGTATNADNVYINEDATDANQPVLFAELVNEYQPVRGNNNFNYNPATDTLTAGTYVESSALKFKENVIHLTGSLQDVEKLQGVTYNKIGHTRKEIGLIADEVVKVLPELVKYQDGEVYGLSYNRLTAVLVEAVKELSDKVKQQEIFIQDLADRLKKLEDKG